MFLQFVTLVVSVKFCLLHSTALAW